MVWIARGDGLKKREVLRVQSPVDLKKPEPISIAAETAQERRRVFMGHKGTCRNIGRINALGLILLRFDKAKGILLQERL